MNSDKNILIIGTRPQGLQAALTIARFGGKATVIEGDFEIERSPGHWSDTAKRWSGLLPLQVSYHPLIETWTETKIAKIKEVAQGIEVDLVQRPQWILPHSCVDCQKCLSKCPVELTNGQKPIFRLTAPNTIAIDKRKKAPCRSACPLDMNVQGYVALIAQGKFDEAYELILKTNPLSEVCGRVCHRPCEKECRRKEIDEPIAICSLKRFAASKAGKKRKEKDRHAGTSIPEGPRVAIVGSGPAGLTAAHDLARAGFRPTLIEAENEPGGLLRQAIASYRLPREILEEEIEEILALGVDLKLNAPVNSREDLEKLGAEGFQTILLAIGASKDRRINIKGEDLEGIYGCVAFLNRLWKGQRPESIGRVVIIGGGNAAVEAARAGVRSGAGSVSLLYRRRKKEMPADPHEIAQALEEGVKLRPLILPVEFEGIDNRLSRIRCVKMKLEGVDSSGRPYPVPIDGSDFFINADTAIISIGQQAEIPFGMAGDLVLTRQGTIKIAGDGQSDIPGIYASGDVVSGPSTVVEAMASGRKAALQIIRALRPAESTAKDKGHESHPGEYDPIPKGIPRQARRPVPHREIHKRIKDCDEVIGPYSTKEAIEEASRCLQCGQCSECRQCEESCELGAINHGRDSTQGTFLFDRIIVADNDQIFTELESSRVIRVPSGKSTSFPKAMIDGRVAALDALSNAPLEKAGPISRKAIKSPDQRIALFICSCNGTLNENGRLDEMIAPLEKAPGVSHVEVLISACHPEKGRRIEEVIRKTGSNGALIASCACCHLDFVCESCSDQRIRLKHRLFREAGFEQKDVALVNIKETCLLPFKDESKNGIDQALRVIRSGLWQLSDHREWILRGEQPHPQALILGATEAGLAAAKCLKDRLPSVVVVEEKAVDKEIAKELRECGIELIRPVRPTRLEGHSGEFSLIVERNAAKQQVSPNRKTRDKDPRYQKIPAGLVILGSDEFKNVPYQRDPYAREFHIGKKKAFGTLETGIPGVYMASWSQARKIPRETSGKAAAGKALEGIFQRADRPDYLVAHVNRELCRGCGRCADICPEGAAWLQEAARGAASSWIEPGLCGGCGNCMAECPTGAITMPESEQGYFEKVIDVFLG